MWYIRNVFYLIVFVLQGVAKICMSLNDASRSTYVSASELETLKINSGVEMFTERPAEVSEEFYVTDVNFKSTVTWASEIATTKAGLAQNTSLNPLKDLFTPDKEISFNIHTSEMPNIVYSKTQTGGSTASTLDMSTAVSSNKPLKLLTSLGITPPNGSDRWTNSGNNAASTLDMSTTIRSNVSHMLLTSLGMTSANGSIKQVSFFSGPDNSSLYQSASPAVTPKSNLYAVQTPQTSEYASNFNFRNSSEDHKIHSNSNTTTSVLRTAQAHSSRWLSDITALFNVTGSLLGSSGLVTDSTVLSSSTSLESSSELSSVKTAFLMTASAEASSVGRSATDSSLNVDGTDMANLNESIQVPTMAATLTFSEDKFLSVVHSGNLDTSNTVSTLSDENRNTVVSDVLLLSSPLHSRPTLSTPVNAVLNITGPQPSATGYHNVFSITNDAREESGVTDIGFFTRLISTSSLPASPTGIAHSGTSALENSIRMVPATEVTIKGFNFGTSGRVETPDTHSLSSRMESIVTRSLTVASLSDYVGTATFEDSFNGLQNVTVSHEVLRSGLTQTPYTLYNFSNMINHNKNVSTLSSMPNAQTTADFTSDMVPDFVQSSTESFLNTTVVTLEMSGTSNSSSLGLLDNYTDFTKSSVLEAGDLPSSPFSALPVFNSHSAVTKSPSLHTERSTYVLAQHNASADYSTFPTSHSRSVELYNLSSLPSVTDVMPSNAIVTVFYPLNTVVEDSTVSAHSNAEAVTYGYFFSNDTTNDLSQSSNVPYSQMNEIDPITGTLLDTVLDDEANLHLGTYTTDAMLTETDSLGPCINVTQVDQGCIGPTLSNSSSWHMLSTTGGSVKNSTDMYLSSSMRDGSVSPVDSSVMTYPFAVTEGTDILYTVASKSNATAVEGLSAHPSSSATSVEPLNSSLNALSLVTTLPVVNINSPRPGASVKTATNVASDGTFLYGSSETTRLKNTGTAVDIVTLQNSTDAGSLLSSPVQMYKSAKTTRSENEVTSLSPLSAFLQTSTDTGSNFIWTSTDSGHHLSSAWLAYHLTKSTKLQHAVSTLQKSTDGASHFSSPRQTTTLMPVSPTSLLSALVTRRTTAASSTSKHSKPLLYSTSSKAELFHSVSTLGIDSDMSYTTSLLYTADLTTGRKSTMQGSTSYALPLLPLTFKLDGIEYSSSLTNSSSEEYRKLEEQMQQTLARIFASTFGNAFVEMRVLGFKKGSVIVDSEIIFKSISQRPSSSDLVRTVITFASNNSSGFSWQIVPVSVQCSGYNITNLEPEKVVISFTGVGMGSSDSEKGVLTALQSSVMNVLMDAYPVQNFTILQIRNDSRNLEILGAAYLHTTSRASPNRVLKTLYGLNQSIDLSTLTVNGVSANVAAVPVKFSITNRVYDGRLADHYSTYYQNFVGALKAAVESTLEEKYKNFMQLVIRNIIPGSVVSQGVLIFLKPAPENTDVLNTLVGSLDSGLFLKGTNFLIDPLSIRIGDAKITDQDTRSGVPGYGVAIIVMCGLCILFSPLLILLYLKKGHFKRGKLYVSRRQHDIEHGSQLELDNNAFRQSLEQMQGNNDHDFLTHTTTSFVSKLH